MFRLYNRNTIGIFGALKRLTQHDVRFIILHLLRDAWTKKRLTQTQTNLCQHENSIPPGLWSKSHSAILDNKAVAKRSDLLETPSRDVAHLIQSPASRHHRVCC